MDSWAIIQTAVGVGLGIFLGTLLTTMTDAGMNYLHRKWRERKFVKIAKSSLPDGKDWKEQVNPLNLTRANRFEAVLEKIPAGTRENKRW